MPSRLTGSRTRSTPARTALSSALALVLLTASTACADFSRDVYMGDSGKHLSRTDLENRPSYDDAVARYDELRAGIQEVVTSAMPHAKEISRPGGEKARCSIDVESVELADVTSRYAYRAWGVQARPTEEEWTEILEGISPLLEEHDFDTINMDAEIGNVRRVAVEDRYGASLALSYDKALAVSLMTGCHLTEE